LKNKKNNILKFWRDIEIFNLLDFSDKLGYLDKNAPLPWTVTQQPLEEAKRRYILYFGKHKKLHITTLIENLIGETQEKPDWMEKVSGDTCMAVLILEENGTISEENAYVQASYMV